MNRRHRRSVRLQGHDYSQTDPYFVTMCTHNRECFFGDVVDRQMRLNEWGRIVESEWLTTPSIRPNVQLDKHIVMPNHVHAIVFIVDGRGTARRAPTSPDTVPVRERFGKLTREHSNVD